MQGLADTLLHTVDSIPGMPFRTRHHDGRFKRGLRSLLALVGVVSIALAALVGVATFRGYDSGSLNLVVAIGIGLTGGWLLIGGIGCVVRAFRNPKHAPLPSNVIPLHIVRARAQSSMRVGQRSQ